MCRSITSADADVLKVLAEISMLGNDYSFTDKARWHETCARF
jgi:hypothetical protein